MVSREIEIVNETGLHTRAGKRFVDEAKQRACDVLVRKGDVEYNAKSLLKLLKAGISKGNRITIVCDGEGESEALESLCDFVANLQE